MAEDDARRGDRNRPSRREASRGARRESSLIEGQATDLPNPVGGSPETESSGTFLSQESDLPAGSSPHFADVRSETSLTAEPSTGVPGEGVDLTAAQSENSEAPAADDPGSSAATPANADVSDRSGSILPALATLAIAALAIAVIYLFSQLSGLAPDTAALADLRSKVAALETKPDPDRSNLTGRVDDIDKTASQLRSGLASLSKQFDSLAASASASASAPASPSASPEQLTQVQSQVADLRQDLDRLKTAFADLPKPDISRVDSRIGDVDQKVSALQAAVGEIPRVDLGPLNTKLDTLETRIKPVETEVDAAKSPQRVAERQAAPMAVTAQAIVWAIEAGKAFPKELKALEALGADPVQLAPLQTVAASGAPSLHDLQAGLSDLRDRMVAAGAQAATGSYMDRLMAGASKLVQVRPAGSVVGDTAAAIVARMDADIGADDLTAALTEWEKLPDASRSASKGLVDRIRLRLDAENAAKGIATNAIGAMAPQRG